MLDVVRNINAIYEKRKISLIGLCQRYAAEAREIFRKEQSEQTFWNNITSQAYANVFGGVLDESDFIGFFLAHGKDYGVYLELANNRQNEALKPIIDSLWPQFIKDVKDIYGAN